MQVVWEFIKDNWLLVTGCGGGLITIVLVPALRTVVWKGLQLALKKLGQAVMSMLTAEFFEKAVIWALRKLAQKTKGDWDDKLVDELEKAMKKE